MATKFGEGAYVGKDIMTILQDAHLKAREQKPGNMGKISTKVDSISTSENSKGDMVVLVRVSYYIDD